MVALKKQLPKGFFDNIPDELKLFCREVKKELRDEGHVVIGVTGYPGVGKSNNVAVISCLIDDEYDFEKSICFIPTSKQIEETYMSLPMYSVLHIDEASRGLHKHKWHDKVQQKVNELYDTEREGHFLCTILIMPRFQNFAENFRNFMIKYWVHIPRKGIAVFYKKDEDKDAKDPWHIDENYKMKLKKWRGKRIFERGIGDVIRTEQVTDCYWFYAQVPPIPKEIWSQYQSLKAGSRVKSQDTTDELETYKEKVTREKRDRWNRIVELKNKGLTQVEIAVSLGRSPETIRKDLREIEAYLSLQGKGHQGVNPQVETSNIYNQLNNTKILETKGQGDKVLNVTLTNEKVEKALEEKE